MKKIYISIVFILLIVIIGTLTYKEEEIYNINGKAEISVKEYDFGEITYLDTVNYTFKIKNIGNEFLIINKVLPNCTCTIIEYNSGIIEKDSIGEVKAQFIPEKTRLGKNTASILVEGNFNGGITHFKIKGIVTDTD